MVDTLALGASERKALVGSSPTLGTRSEMSNFESLRRLWRRLSYREFSLQKATFDSGSVKENFYELRNKTRRNNAIHNLRSQKY